MTLHEIRAAAVEDSFPVERLRGATTSASFYCAAFLGQYDACRLAVDLEIRDGFLIDTDAQKLADMLALYPRGWRTRSDDAIERARAWQFEGRTFDVVTVDPWNYDVAKVLDELPLWCSLARRHVVIGMNAGEWCAARAIEPTVEGVGGWIEDAFPGLPGRVVEVRKRSNHLGGVYWIVLEIEDPDAAVTA